MQVWNVLRAARWKYTTQKSRQKLPSGHHRTTLSGYIFATKATIGKKHVKQQYLLHMSSQYGELQPTNGWDRSGSWRAPRQIPMGFASWQQPQHYCTALYVVVSISQTLRCWTERRPPHWALAHISSLRHSVGVSVSNSRSLSWKHERKKADIFHAVVEDTTQL